MNRYVIGIDPGLKGGIAVLEARGDVVEVVTMPQTPLDILAFLRQYFAEQCVAYLEDVGHGMPGQSSKATATFARHCGHLEMALLSLGIKTNVVTPQKWQKAYQLGKSGEYTKSEWKNKLKAKAQQLFPKEKVTLKNADALLIAEYGRKKEIAE